MAEATNGREAMTRSGRSVATAAVAVAASFAFAGCSSLSGGSPAPATTATAPSPAPSDNSSFSSRFTSLFSSSPKTVAAAPSSAGGTSTPPNIDCPAVDYREGAATISVNGQAAPGENAALNLRYQGSFVQVARECAVRSGQLNIKVGVQGRVVVGPAGGPGQITLPLRYALVREGLQPKTLWTKLYIVPVTIPDNQLNVPFTHIEEEMSVPLPPAVELDAYVIYIGFDPEGAAPPPKPPPKARVKPRTAAAGAQ